MGNVAPKVMFTAWELWVIVRCVQNWNEKSSSSGCSGSIHRTTSLLRGTSWQEIGRCAHKKKKNPCGVLLCVHTCVGWALSEWDINTWKLQNYCRQKGWWLPRPASWNVLQGHLRECANTFKANEIIWSIYNDTILVMSIYTYPPRTNVQVLKVWES